MTEGLASKGMRMMKLQRMWQMPFRGSIDRMQDLWKVSCHFRARDMYITADAGFPFGPGFGPFRHW